MVRKLLDKTFWKFILTGVINTLFGTGIMFLFYNVFHLGYWVSSASNYVFGSILSFFLNKHFTFQDKHRTLNVAIRFAINILVCYLAAYGLAQPITQLLLSRAAPSFRDNGALLIGMCVFVALNYLGQRYFVFKEEKVKETG